MLSTEKNPNPTKDQHFMVDKIMIEKIQRTANILPGENIVEIGGGAGAITEGLAKLGNQLTVIEKDSYYANILRNKFAGYDNVTIIEGDALEHDFCKYDRIVANLPYTITEAFLINLAQSGALNYDPKDYNSTRVKSITLVVSQNSTRKMVAPVQITEGKCHHYNQEFGLISAICHTFLSIDVECVIPSSAFFPEPSVTSFLVNMIPKSKKTTVDRIMSEIFLDKRNRKPTIGRIYQLMLAQGKVYNIKKYKNNVQQTTQFTSKIIFDSNIYALNNTQISQLIQDLIRNDYKMKCCKSNIRYEDDSYAFFLKTGSYDFDDFQDEKEEENNVLTKAERNAREKYSYWYEEERYELLLHRGLEYKSNAELTGLFSRK